MSSIRPGPLVEAMLGAGCLSVSPILMSLADVSPVTIAFYRCVLPLPVLAMRRKAASFAIIHLGLSADYPSNSGLRLRCRLGTVSAWNV